MYALTRGGWWQPPSSPLGRVLTIGTVQSLVHLMGKYSSPWKFGMQSVHVLRMRLPAYVYTSFFQETLFHTTPACWVAVVHTHWEIMPCENNTFTTFKCPQTHVSSPGHQPAVNSHPDFSHLQATVVQHTAEQYEGLGKRGEVQN